MTPAPDRAEPCTECDKVRVEQALIAEEAARAANRDLAKLDIQHQYDLDQLERAKQRDADAAEEAAVTAVQEAQWQADAELGKLFHETLAEVAKGSVERSRDSAKYVQTAAAAIAALYTGVLALVFSVTDNPLPVRGVAAPAFLGLAVALATAYLAFITTPTAPPMYRGGGSLSELQLNRTAFLTRWINSIVNNRRWAVRASVLSLAFGVAFVPAAFVGTHRAPSIPAAPAAPTIPAQVAPEVATAAARSFVSQVTSFDAAVNARNAAIASASTAVKAGARDERTANVVTLILGVVALVAVLVGPTVIETD